MKRKVQLVLLCEDQQQEAFLRRFLQGTRWSQRELRVERGRPGAGGHAFVTSRFPIELQAYRTRHVERALVVMIDGDNLGVAGRIDALDRACVDAGVPRRRGEDRVAVAVPTWNIETWLAHLNGATIDERHSSFACGQRRIMQRRRVGGSTFDLKARNGMPVRFERLKIGGW